MINSTLQTPIESIRFFAHFKKVKMTKIRQDKQIMKEKGETASVRPRLREIIKGKQNLSRKNK